MTKEELIKIIEKEGEYKAFMYHGYPCRIIRRGMESLIHLCGYVGIPKTHLWYGKDYDDIDADVHGGLTYASHSLRYQPETDFYWIGFDCAHAGDFCSMFDLEYEHVVNERFETYKNMGFVEKELKKLVRQVEKV